MRFFFLSILFFLTFFFFIFEMHIKKSYTFFYCTMYLYNNIYLVTLHSWNAHCCINFFKYCGSLRFIALVKRIKNKNLYLHLLHSQQSKKKTHRYGAKSRYNVHFVAIKSQNEKNKKKKREKNYENHHQQRILEKRVAILIFSPSFCSIYMNSAKWKIKISNEYPLYLFPN